MAESREGYNADTNMIIPLKVKDIVRVITDGGVSNELYMVSEKIDSNRFVLEDGELGKIGTYYRSQLYYQHIPKFLQVVDVDYNEEEDDDDNEMKDTEINVDSGVKSPDEFRAWCKNTYNIEVGVALGMFDRLLISFLNYYSIRGYICIYYKRGFTITHDGSCTTRIEFQMIKNDHKPRDYNGTKYRHFIKYSDSNSDTWVNREVKYDVLPDQ